MDMDCWIVSEYLYLSRVALIVTMENKITAINRGPTKCNGWMDDGSLVPFSLKIQVIEIQLYYHNTLLTKSLVVG